MSSTVIITGANPNPPGVDVQVFNGEFVVLQNLSQTTADVGGWFIRDSKDAALVAPMGTTIPPGGRIRVYTGSGVDAAGNVYCRRRRAVLNNEGDVLRLFDNGGGLKQTFKYGSVA